MPYAIILPSTGVAVCAYENIAEINFYLNGEEIEWMDEEVVKASVFS
jgi:hypothetical protein